MVSGEDGTGSHSGLGGCRGEGVSWVEMHEAPKSEMPACCPLPVPSAWHPHPVLPVWAPCTSEPWFCLGSIELPNVKELSPPMTLSSGRPYYIFA